jgi:hypothetical protein
MQAQCKTLHLGCRTAAAIALGLVPALSGCTTLASMAVKHVATKAGISVAKSAYHKLKGQDKKPAEAASDKYSRRKPADAASREDTSSDGATRSDTE